MLAPISPQAPTLTRAPDPAGPTWVPPTQEGDEGPPSGCASHEAAPRGAVGFMAANRVPVSFSLAFKYVGQSHVVKPEEQKLVL